MIGFMIVGGIVNSRLKSKFKKYSKIPTLSGMSGKEIAEKMLSDNSILDVKVVSVPGKLTDHYNPLDKTINLSPDVYQVRHVSAAAIAAHECGHAVQHATAYSWLQMRSQLVPVVSVTSGMSQWLIIGGLILGGAAGLGLGWWVAVAGLAFMGFATLFSFITLPVEYDASNRALAWLKAKNMVTPEEYEGSEDALKWAARTYLVAAIGALASLLYWALQVFGRD